MPLGGLLIFGALGLGYDYAWLVMLAPFAQLSSLSAVLLLAFVGVVWWAWSGRQKNKFEQASRMPLEEDSDKNEDK